MQHIGDGGSISFCGWDLLPSCKCPHFQASGHSPTALCLLLPPCMTYFQFHINGDRKGEPGNKNEIVKGADKFVYFIFFFLFQVSGFCCNTFHLIHHMQGLHDLLWLLHKRQSSRYVAAQDTWPREKEGRVRCSIHHEAQDFQIPTFCFALTTFLWIWIFF